MVTIEDLTPISAPIERCFDLARSVEVHLAGNDCAWHFPRHEARPLLSSVIAQ